MDNYDEYDEYDESYAAVADDFDEDDEYNEKINIYDIQEMMDSAGKLVDDAANLLMNFQQRSEAIADSFQQNLRSAVDWQEKSITDFIKNELSDVTRSYVEDLEESRKSITHAANEAEKQVTQLKSDTKKFIFKMYLLAGLGLIFFVIGGGLLSYYYAQVISRNKVEADTARLIMQSDVVRCGNDKLCAKVKKGKRDEYVEINKK